MAKIDLDGDGKADVSISLPQIITIAAMFASIVGSYYTLSAEIDSNTAEVTKLKYNEKEYTWKNQRELEKEVREITLEMRDFMKDLEYLKKGKKGR
tara:strand:- start:4237 stop:4524 length:288 start_codon:yes stop_codon:yes gene_type:complete